MNTTTALEEITQSLDRLEPLKLRELKPEKTLLIIIDMINGFAVSGALASPRVGALTPVIARLSSRCDELGIRKLAFGDSHSEGSAEFSSYPPHCLAGTSEAEVVEALKAVGGYTFIAKNSTNGFLEEEFLRFIGAHPDMDTFILTGDCTDICVLQFALSLKAHFNRLNLSSRVIVPKNAVDTYDAPGHDAALTGIMALYNMRLNGVEVVKSVD